jgi:hypothetical protein
VKVSAPESLITGFQPAIESREKAEGMWTTRQGASSAQPESTTFCTTANLKHAAGRFQVGGVFSIKNK